MSLTNPVPRRPDDVRTNHRGDLWKFLLMALLLLPYHFTVHGQPAGGARRQPYGPNDPLYRNPQPDYWQVWRGIKINSDHLLKTLGATNTGAAMLLRQIQTNAHFLEGKWDAWFRDHDQPGQYNPVDYYLVILRADSRQLGDLKKENNTTKALAVIQNVALDLQLKADNCRHSADGLGKDIKVKVHTKADDQEVKGYEVFCVPRGMLEVKSAHDRFPRLSSPTDEKILSPGRYAIWVRRKTFTSEPTTLSIGGHGETKLEVDISVPAE